MTNPERKTTELIYSIPPTTRSKPPYVIDVDGNPLVIDLDEVQDELAIPPSTADLIPCDDEMSTELAVPLRTIYTTTTAAHVKDWFAEGTGVIAVLGMGAVGLGIATVLSFIAFVEMILGVIAANASNIVGVLLIIGMVALIPVYLKGRGRSSNYITVKGCPKGKTPGSHRIRRG